MVLCCPHHAMPPGGGKNGMTRAYVVWTEDEQEALRRGVKKHGLGAWEIIRKDQEFAVLEWVV